MSGDTGHMYEVCAAAVFKGKVNLRLGQRECGDISNHILKKGLHGKDV